MNAEILKIEKKINAEPSRLFKAWLKPEDLARWFLSGDSTNPITIESVSMDPRTGGRFVINMKLEGKLYPHAGEYVVIDEPAKLVFTWRSHATGDLDTLVTITFKALPDVKDAKSRKTIPQTLLTLIHERLPGRKQIEMHTQGWTNILAGLENWMGEGG